LVTVTRSSEIGEERTPGVGTRLCAAGDVLVRVLIIRKCGAVEAACFVVVSPSRGVRKCVVCVVDGLETFGALGALGRVDWDAVGVPFQSRLFVGSLDVLLCSRGRDFEYGI
jgi:hypothetical protein